MSLKNRIQELECLEKEQTHKIGLLEKLIAEKNSQIDSHSREKEAIKNESDATGKSMLELKAKYDELAKKSQSQTHEIEELKSEVKTKDALLDDKNAQLDEK